MGFHHCQPHKKKAKSKVTIVTLLWVASTAIFELDNVKTQSLSFDESEYNLDAMQTKSKVTNVILLLARFKVGALNQIWLLNKLFGCAAKPRLK